MNFGFTNFKEFHLIVSAKVFIESSMIERNPRSNFLIIDQITRTIVCIESIQTLDLIILSTLSRLVVFINSLYFVMYALKVSERHFPTIMYHLDNHITENRSFLDSFCTARSSETRF
jgi:hypothetical protein